MQTSSERFVAHLDILGMSSITEANPEEAWRLLSDLVAVRDRIGGYKMEFIDTKQMVKASDVAVAVTFSDTIVLFSNGATDTELRALLILVTELLHKAMFRCVPVRAGIAKGRFFVDMKRSMYAGPALIEAYRSGESAQWLGVCLGASVKEQALSLGMRTGNRPFVVEWTVPVKGGTEQRWVVDWPVAFAHDFAIKPPITVAQFYAGFHSTFGAFENLPADVRAKYENTVRFVNDRLVRIVQQA